MNLSETAFFMQTERGFRLRWFTPRMEVDLCGHATLATAHIIWQSELVGRDEVISFETRSGLLMAKYLNGWIELDFPAKMPLPWLVPAGLSEALGASPASCFRSEADCLLSFGSEAEIYALRPDFGALAQVDVRAVIVTAPAQAEGIDFVSRFFAPKMGVNEDPVTGSAHCVLGPFWADKLGKTNLVGYQASERGGIVKVDLLDKERVALRGKAVTIFQGVITQDGVSLS